MNTSKTTISLVARAFALVALAASLVSIANGCDGGREGERCNPSLSHNDCDDGLTCQQPSTCVENYCCPADPSKSANPYCNGAGCPTVDAGPPDSATGDSATDDGAADAGDSG
jgi:hypothetical protein